MPLIVTAAQILAAIGDDENPLASFAADYKELRARGFTTKTIAVHLDMSEHAVYHQVRKARHAGLLPPANSRYQSAILVDDWEHGTRAGYQRHLRRGQKACQDCVDGKRAYDKEHPPRRKTRAGQWRDQHGLAS